MTERRTTPATDDPEDLSEVSTADLRAELEERGLVVFVNLQEAVAQADVDELIVELDERGYSIVDDEGERFGELAEFVRDRHNHEHTGPICVCRDTVCDALERLDRSRS